MIDMEAASTCNRPLREGPSKETRSQILQATLEVIQRSHEGRFSRGRIAARAGNAAGTGAGSLW